MANELPNRALEQAINKAVEALLPNGGAGMVEEKQLRSALEQIAEHAQTLGQAEALSSLRTSDEAAAIWAVAPSVARAHIARLHKRLGIGALVGHTWMLTTNDVARYEPSITD